MATQHPVLTAKNKSIEFEAVELLTDDIVDDDIVDDDYDDMDPDYYLSDDEQNQNGDRYSIVWRQITSVRAFLI